MTFAIEDHGLIGDGRTAALVRHDGAIDWLCVPRFDSDACLAALLGTSDQGLWSIAPAGGFARTTRRYLEDTLVLETDFETAEGAVRLIDFMPIGTSGPCVVRLVVGLAGRVAMRMSIGLRFDYGRLMPWVEAQEDGFVARVGPDQVVFRAPVPLEVSHSHAAGAFEVSAGQRLPFVLCHSDSSEAPPAPIDAEAALEHTTKHWREWIGRFAKPTEWSDAVRRSLLTLRTLSHHPSGGIIAAATTSLPEKPGGTANWDYRYCWLRDAAFTLSSLLNAGFMQEATAWRDWILRAIAAEPAKLRIMYRLDGGRSPPERTLDWLHGWRWSTPVRVGNAAADQFQVDVWGELLDAMELATRAGIEQTEQGLHLERGLVAYLEQIWMRPGQGLWESRGEPRHHTYSRVMAWAGVDRFLRSAARFGHADEATTRRLAALRSRIHAEVCEEGYHAGLGTFVEHYGGQHPDASLLLLPLVGFLRADEPRMARTIAMIERELMHDGLVMRHASDEEGQPAEGAFLACTCWLADCRLMQGREQEARAALERVLALRNDLGLLSEEYNIRGRHLAGNFPQALSHLALVNTALQMSGPVIQRGGG